VEFIFCLNILSVLTPSANALEIFNQEPRGSFFIIKEAQDQVRLSLYTNMFVPDSQFLNPGLLKQYFLTGLGESAWEE
jgi:hypothetical protein